MMLCRCSFIALFLLAAAAAAGCSTVAYDEAYKKSVAGALTRSEFAKLQPDGTNLPGERFLIQPPKILPDVLHDKAADPRAKKRADGEEVVVDARRLYPPFLERYPGFFAAWEGAFEVGNAKLPATLSVGAVPVAELSEPQIAAKVVEQLKRVEAFEKAAFKWESREVVDKNGQQRVWRVMRMHGPQPIDRWVADVEEYKPVDATCEIWLSADRDQPVCTVLTWRVPDEIAEKVKLDELAPLVARSVVPAPKP